METSKLGLPLRCLAWIALGTLAASQGTVSLDIPPSNTAPAGVIVDPIGCDGAGNLVAVTGIEHWAGVNPTVAQNDRLFVFLPGTGGHPSDSRHLLESAADAGYHAIGLAYWNQLAIEKPCAGSGSPDSPCEAELSCDESGYQDCSCDTCMEDARLAIILGEDRSLDIYPGVVISTENSITGRLKLLLVYLANQYPNYGWGSFLSGNEVAWDMIVLAGHSQGAGHAAYIAKHLHEVERVFVNAGPLDSTCAGDPSPWLSAFADPVALLESRTPYERWYGIAHQSDASHALMLAAWGSGGLGALSTLPTAQHLPMGVPGQIDRLLLSDDPHETGISQCVIPPHGAAVRDWCPTWFSEPHNEYDQVWPYLAFGQAMKASYEAGCDGVLAVDADPVLGATLGFSIASATPGSIGWIGVSSPAPATVLAAGCELYIDPNPGVVGTYTIDSQGRASLTATISPSYEPGTVQRVQGVHAKPDGQPGTTQAIDLILGYP